MSDSEIQRRAGIMQYSFIMIKPNFLQFADEIIGKIADKTNAEVVVKKQFRLTPELCDRHYAHIINETFYGGHKQYMLSGDCIGAILRSDSDSLIDEIRAIVGDTRGQEVGTLRHYYRKLTGAKEIWENAVHCSGYDRAGNPEGTAECKRFADILGVDFE